MVNHETHRLHILTTKRKQPRATATVNDLTPNGWLCPPACEAGHSAKYFPAPNCVAKSPYAPALPNDGRTPRHNMETTWRPNNYSAKGPRKREGRRQLPPTKEPADMVGDRQGVRASRRSAGKDAVARGAGQAEEETTLGAEPTFSAFLQAGRSSACLERLLQA